MSQIKNFYKLVFEQHDELQTKRSLLNFTVYQKYYFVISTFLYVENLRKKIKILCEIFVEVKEWKDEIAVAVEPHSRLQVTLSKTSFLKEEKFSCKMKQCQLGMSIKNAKCISLRRGNNLNYIWKILVYLPHNFWLRVHNLKRTINSKYIFGWFLRIWLFQSFKIDT